MSGTPSNSQNFKSMQVLLVTAGSFLDDVLVHDRIDPYKQGARLDEIRQNASQITEHLSSHPGKALSYNNQLEVGMILDLKVYGIELMHRIGTGEIRDPQAGSVRDQIIDTLAQAIAATRPEYTKPSQTDPNKIIPASQVIDVLKVVAGKMGDERHEANWNHYLTAQGMNSAQPDRQSMQTVREGIFDMAVAIQMHQKYGTPLNFNGSGADTNFIMKQYIDKMEEMIKNGDLSGPAAINTLKALKECTGYAEQEAKKNAPQIERSINGTATSAYGQNHHTVASM